MTEVQETKPAGRGRGGRGGKPKAEGKDGEAEGAPASRGRGRGAKPKAEGAEDGEKAERPQTAKPSTGRGRGGRKDAPKEESKADRPQTAEGARGRGGRGGRGNARGGRQDRDREENSEEREARDRKPRQPRAQDPNAWISKFHNEAERKKYDTSIEITPETEVPALPEKEDIIKVEPDKKDLEKELNRLEDEAKVIQKKKDAQIKKKQEYREGGTVGKGNTTAGGLIKSLIQEQKELTKEKRGIQDQMNVLQKAYDELETKK